MGRQQKSQRGFTLIELMIAVVIVGILAGVGYPAFADYVRKGRRAEAISALLQFQMAQESFRVRQAAPTYNSAMVTPATTFYTYKVNSATTTAFTITATAIGTQASDTGCTTLVITDDGPDVTDATKRACWSR